MNNELIYSINEIFQDYLDKENTGATSVNYKYHIRAYQRGYKWGSGQGGAVSVLLRDLKEAYDSFLNQHRKEYYLQYITLKKNVAEHHMEVIDGQQRLTTLSILISVCSAQLNIPNISAGKLDYAIRGTFFDDHIYSAEQLSELLKAGWDKRQGIQLNGKPYNNQDIYYIYHAARAINEFFNSLDPVYKTLFFQFILKNVKLIVNSVEPHVKSEKVFSNLNSNKVPLTESELIKGLLITRVGRKTISDQRKKNFREVLETRLTLGRRWDEISRWSNKPEIRSLLLGSGDGMLGLLYLVANAFNKNSVPAALRKDQKGYPLFDFYHKQPDMEKIFQQLIDQAAMLNDWYKHDETYNLLGYCLCAKQNNIDREKLLGECLGLNKSELKTELLKRVNKLIPEDISQLFYDERNDEIHRVLLALSVFTPGQIIRFNYYDYSNSNWSLEHVFPQSPEGKGRILTEEDKGLILEMLGDNATPEVKRILALKERNEEEKEVYYKALKNGRKTNSMGNMCLLTGGDNSSNGCGFFNAKRENILRQISKGSFVPKHTFEVFSKMILKKNPGDFTRWTPDNIEKHAEAIAESLSHLKTALV